jgi:hypothetical protein
MLRTMSPGATVIDGGWVEGPDGRRDRDVWVEGTHNEKPCKLLIECKDYDSAKKRTIGVEVIDALESKRRDLGANRATVFSNAGFSPTAIRKAARLGIALLAAIGSEDARIRNEVRETVYTRRIRIVKFVSHFSPVPLVKQNPDLELLSYRGAPVKEWLLFRIHVVLSKNPVVSGTLHETFPLLRPTLFRFPDGGLLMLDSIGYTVEFEGEWSSHAGVLISDGALYDWRRKRFRPGPGRRMLGISGINPYHGKRVSVPPPHVIARPTREDGERFVDLLIIEGMTVGDPRAELNDLFSEEQLDDYMIRNLPVSAYTSTEPSPFTKAYEESLGPGSTKIVGGSVFLKK